MAPRLNPYLNFRGRAREALDFYASVFGGDVVVTTFGELGEPPPGSQATDVMHGQLETPTGFTLMGADVPRSMELTQGDNVTVSLSGDDVDALRGPVRCVLAGQHLCRLTVSYPAVALDARPVRRVEARDGVPPDV